MTDDNCDGAIVHPDQAAGQDLAIASALEADPEDTEAQLDQGLDESMDASDPPSAVQPGTSSDVVPSSGYDPALEAEIERKRAAAASA